MNETSPDLNATLMAENNRSWISAEAITARRCSQGAGQHRPWHPPGTRTRRCCPRPALSSIQCYPQCWEPQARAPVMADDAIVHLDIAHHP